eukprot:3257507-Rhodomonas_salina.1
MHRPSRLELERHAINPLPDDVLRDPQGPAPFLLDLLAKVGAVFLEVTHALSLLNVSIHQHLVQLLIDVLQLLEVLDLPKPSNQFRGVVVQRRHTRGPPFARPQNEGPNAVHEGLPRPLKARNPSILLPLLLPSKQKGPERLSHRRPFHRFHVAITEESFFF